MAEHTMGAGSDRLVGAATTQSLFREVNERMKYLNESLLPTQTSAEWVCECENDLCVERISMTLPEYERLRASGNRFAVIPGHEVPEVEEVIEQYESYVVVAKRGAGGAYATERDPRSQGGNGAAA